MDITTRLTHLDEMVREAKAMPLSSSVLVNRDEVLDLIVEMQESLPAEIEQARWIVKDREDLLAKARAEAGVIVEQARAEQLGMARQQEVVARAAEEAERDARRGERAGAVDAARGRGVRRRQARTVRGRAPPHLEDSQASVRALAKTLDQVEVGREKLRTPGTAAAQEFGGPDPHPGEHDERAARGETPLYDEEQR